MARPALVLYFDIVSPFAYLAFHVLRTSSVFRDCTITYVPVSIGRIIKETGNTPPLEIKNKGEWIIKQRFRWARQFNIPLADSLPPGFPKDTRPVMRALTVVAQQYPQKLEELIAAIYEASFVTRQDVHSLEAVKPIMNHILGEPAASEITSQAASPEIKQALIDETDQALASGAFGLPWFKATNSMGQAEYFWGFDHLGQVCLHLGLQRPRPGSADDVDGWKAML